LGKASCKGREALLIFSNFFCFSEFNKPPLGYALKHPLLAGYKRSIKFRERQFTAAKPSFKTSSGNPEIDLTHERWTRQPGAHHHIHGAQ
jgi:hypothetical protein